MLMLPKENTIKSSLNEVRSNLVEKPAVTLGRITFIGHLFKGDGSRDCVKEFIVINCITEGGSLFHSLTMSLINKNLV